MNTPTGRREALEVLIRRGLSQRKACRYLGLSRRVPAYKPKQPEKDRLLGEQLIAASQEVPRFGYRRISAWLSLGRIAGAPPVASPEAEHPETATAPATLRQRL